MLKPRFLYGLLALLLSTFPAHGAKFTVKDISNQQWCLHSMLPLSAEVQAALCSTYPQGTVRVTITPEPEELPVRCYDNGQSGSFCMYSADFYVAAYYRGKWLTKKGYTWTPVDISYLPATTAWPPWGGTTSMSYDFYVGEVDLDTSKTVLPPAGLEVWAGIVPSGSTVFAPEQVAKIYPVTP